MVAPPGPKQVVLHTTQPFAPASPFDLEDKDVAKTTAVAVSAVAEKTIEANQKVDSTLLALACTIRWPRAYVGHNAFVLMGLCKKCRHCVWEGATFINLLQVYALGHYICAPNSAL